MFNIAPELLLNNLFFFSVVNFKNFLLNFLVTTNDCVVYTFSIYYDIFDIFTSLISKQYVMCCESMKQFDSKYDKNNSNIQCLFGTWYWDYWSYLEKLRELLRQQREYKLGDSPYTLGGSKISGLFQHMCTTTKRDPQEVWEEIRKIGLKIQESRTIKLNVPEKLPSPDSDTSVYSDAFEEIIFPKKVDAFEEAFKELKDKILEPATIFIIIAVFSTAVITALIMDFDFCSCDSSTSNNPTPNNSTTDNSTTGNSTTSN